MKRAQIILEDWQFQWLKERARQERVPLSALIRRFVTEKAEPRAVPEGDPFRELAGSLEGPKGGRRSESLDERLYRK